MNWLSNISALVLLLVCLGMATGQQVRVPSHRQHPTPRVNPTVRPLPRPVQFPPPPQQPQQPVQYVQVPVYQPTYQPAYRPQLENCNGDFYNPSFQMCCHSNVLAITGPVQFAECCNGEVIDNRTEKCCLGQERALFDQACCGAEAYDIHGGEQCCGDRYLFDPGYDMCCQGYLSPTANHICCEKGPVVVDGGVSSAVCCGCGFVNADKQMCCGGQAIDVDSNKEACCSGTTVYDPSSSTCCPVDNAMGVIQGKTCRGASSIGRMAGARGPPLPPAAGRKK